MGNLCFVGEDMKHLKFFSLGVVVFFCLAVACTQQTIEEPAVSVEATQLLVTETAAAPEATLPAATAAAPEATARPTEDRADAAPPVEENSAAIPFVETEVEFVTAQQDLLMFSGPGESYEQIGSVFDGQTALVTGQSEDGNWWRVICPDDTVGDCWVTADSAMTEPIERAAIAQQSNLVSAGPLFVGADLQYAGWSADGRYLAYFEYTEEQVEQSPVEGLRGTYPGTFVFYDTMTGEKCSDYPISGLFSYEGAGQDALWRWLPDGRLLISLPDGQLILTDAPCTPGQDFSSLFSSPVLAFGEMSPDGSWLVVKGADHYSLFNLLTQEVLPIAGIVPDPFNNLVWSPDGRYLSITLAGNYTGDRSPVGGTRVIETDSGQVIATYDWQPANALDGTFGGPIWVDNEAFVVTLSLDQGPFLMNVTGDVQPLLPQFDETFDPENYWPPLDVLQEVENGRYAVLLRNEGREVAKLLIGTAQEETMELFDQLPGVLQIFPDGSMGYELDGQFWTRPVFEIGGQFVQQPATINPWLFTGGRLQALSDDESVTILDRSSGEEINRLQVAGYESGFILNPVLSPDDQWLAIFVNEPQYSLGRALFIEALQSDQ